MPKQGSSMHEQCERPPKRHTKKKESETYLKLMASVHLNMDYGYGVSVLGGPLSVIQIQVS